jgi:hypothetical protein
VCDLEGSEKKRMKCNCTVVITVICGWEQLQVYFFYGFVAKGNMNILTQHFSTRAMNVGNLTNQLCTDQKCSWLAGRFLVSLTSPLLVGFSILGIQGAFQDHELCVILYDLCLVQDSYKQLLWCCVWFIWHLALLNDGCYEDVGGFSIGNRTKDVMEGWSA